MEFTWDSSFKTFFRYTYFCSLPPYSYNYKVGYLTNFGASLFLVRSIPLLITEREFFAEMFFMFCITGGLAVRGYIFLGKRKSFHDLCYEMNKFIRDNKFNPIIGEEDCFLKIWKSSSVFKHAKSYFWFLITVIISWQFPIYYDIATNIENVEYPYYPLYSPYFEYNLFTKLVYTLTDIILDWLCLFNLAQNEIVFMSLTEFLYRQYLYLKKLLDEISGELENEPEKVKWWIENHCRVIRFRNMLQDILAPVIIVNYLCLIGSLAACLSVLSDTSIQSVHQKYTMIILCLVLLGEIGSHSDTMEKINEINKKMHENAWPFNTKGEKLKVSTVYRMIDFMSKKPVELTGVGFFTFKNDQYKDLVFRTYSFYSSLTSLKKAK